MTCSGQLCCAITSQLVSPFIHLRLALFNNAMAIWTLAIRLRYYVVLHRDNMLLATTDRFGALCFYTTTFLCMKNIMMVKGCIVFWCILNQNTCLFVDRYKSLSSAFIDSVLDEFFHEKMHCHHVYNIYLTDLHSSWRSPLHLSVFCILPLARWCNPLVTRL